MSGEGGEVAGEVGAPPVVGGESECGCLVRVMREGGGAEGGEAVAGGTVGVGLEGCGGAGE